MARPSRLSPEEQIIEIVQAASAHLSDTSVEKFRLVEVANALGMSHSNIYRFFKSKEALFDAIVDQWLSDSRAEILAALETDQPALDRLAAMLITLHRSSRRKLERDPNGFALYQHLWSKRSDAAQTHVAFVVAEGVSLITQAIEQQDVLISDPVKAALLIQSATAKFHAPALLNDALAEDTTAQLQSVLNALFYCFRHDPDCLKTL